MTTSNDYQHKKFNKNKVEDGYQHKKFATSKRKFNEIEKEEVPITVEDILQQAQKDISTDLPQIKRKQTTTLFRPWEDKEESCATTITKRPKSCPPTEEVSKINTSQQSNPKVRRNTVGATMRRRQQQHHQQAVQWRRHQQYIAYQQQQQQYHAAIMEQSMRNSNYLAYLQQLALQKSRQQQLFVFGQQH
ncbi:ras-interacting protein RIP3-like [Musca vetustissima]|uniref:ras-interacting protein RIP3-like n=1 Tax=Musca vetustissima TaxID=27455 RepID=UPI002AB7792B|nr:ras-interacting protein RIP3-like [Musca vetustissima]